MKYLAGELHKLYKKAGNRLLFRNGMDANQLSLEMWSRLGFGKVDTSVLSRVMNGKRLFTQEQLDVFSSVMGLSETERYGLRNAMGKDLLKKHLGVIIPISRYGELIADNHTEELITDEVRTLRERGSLREALQLASFFERILTFTPTITNENKSFLTKIINEKVRCLIYVEKPATLLPKVRRLTTVALRMAHELRDPGLISMAEAHIGGCYYVAKMHRASAQSLEASFTIVNDATKVEYIRTLLNDYAFLHDDELYRETYRKAMKILDKQERYNPSHITSMYEALARSLSMVGRTAQARKYLAIRHPKTIETFFESEILRGKMFICYQEYLRGNKVDMDEISDIYNKSNRYPLFKRHRDQISEMYRKMHHV